MNIKNSLPASSLLNIQQFNGNVSQDFGEALIQLVKGWIKSNTYTLSLSNLNQNSVYFKTTQKNSTKDTSKELSDYIIKTVNPSLKKGSLIINTINKTISFSPKKNNATSKKTTPSSYSEYGWDDWMNFSTKDNQTSTNPNEMGWDDWMNFSVQKQNSLTENIKRIKTLIKL